MIVTGGASGIGAQTVRALAKAGAEVTAAVRNPAALQPIIQEAKDKNWPGTINALGLTLQILARYANLLIPGTDLCTHW